MSNNNEENDGRETEALLGAVDPSTIDDDDEEECRVCRFPAEEGQPLFKPCKCRGSIGLIHQECLQSWLQVHRGNGACELCKTPFRFAPQYAPGAPQRLPPQQVLWGLLRRSVAQWLPFAFRIMFAASLWLLVAPILTAYQYHGWMNKPSAILERFGNLANISNSNSTTAATQTTTTWDMFTSDWVSGAVVAAYILVSFLSLMSFADFLRMEWQGGRAHWEERGQAQPRGGAAREAEEDPREEDVDNELWRYVQQKIITKQPRGINSKSGDVNASDSDNANNNTSDPYDSLDDYRLDEDSEDSDFEQLNEEDAILQEFLEELDEEDDDEMDDLPPQIPGPRANHGHNEPAERARPERMPREPIRPVDADLEEPMDVDINIALDEFLGVHGPLTAVIRNLAWLLSFNAVYIGFFCFVPRTVGVMVGTILFHHTATSNSTDSGSNITMITSNDTTLVENLWSIPSIIRAIDAESERQQAAFRLHDFATIALGYFTCAVGAYMIRLLWILSQRIGFAPSADRTDGEAEDGVMGEVNRIVWNAAADQGGVDGDAQVIVFHTTLGAFLDGLVAVVKVGVLLFLKMFLLPTLLGVCLDASVASLFHSTLEDRIKYAGSDLFSFVLLHWVLGITFMLLVTVSVLQLREVVHPDLLSQVIRPQEPQPDLLGNLMHESIGTHARRMVVSLIIYAVLWAMHIYVPSKVLGSGIVQTFLPELRLKLCYFITPKLQVPFELCFFHLCMLGLLERYKNGLGEMQHHWLKLLTRIMGIQDRVMPMKVARFQYVGSREVFQGQTSLASFWYKLAKAEANREEMIESVLSDFNPILHDQDDRNAVPRVGGQWVLDSESDYIRLPVFLPGKSVRSRSILLPTKIGKYRLDRKGDTGDKQFLHLWKEKTGDIIPRPPEGWDDLGAEPPDIQGRWAYGHERKSAIESGVARRIAFYTSKQNWMQKWSMTAKLFVLFSVSWAATTIILCTMFVAPVSIGRLVYYILRVPDKWVHDPAAFLVGFLLVFPVVVVGARAVVSSNVPVWRRILAWLRGFHFPPSRKTYILVQTIILWCFISPLCLGMVYDLMFIKTIDWYAGKEEAPVGTKAIVMCWTTGSVLLYGWSFLCTRGILTRQFRVFVLEGRELADDENEANARAAAWVADGNGLRLTWQGDHGRMAQFWGIWNAVLLNWEFDKIDKTILLDYVAIPVTQCVSMTVGIPLVFAAVYSWLGLSPVGIAVVTRSLVVLMVCLQTTLVWRDQIQSWFETAHKAARDDLYLTGEVLLNDGEE